MITLRFSDGSTIVYENANFVVDKQTCTDLYTAPNGTWLASVKNSLACIIESSHAKIKTESIKKKSHTELQAIKRQLQNYNCNTRRWK